MLKPTHKVMHLWKKVKNRTTLIDQDKETGNVGEREGWINLFRSKVHSGAVLTIYMAALLPHRKKVFGSTRFFVSFLFLIQPPPTFHRQTG